MKILHVAAESVPFAKTGGLADVVGSLPRELIKQGLDVRVIMPKYRNISSHLKEDIVFKRMINVPVGWKSQYCGIEETTLDGVTFYFIDNEYYFGREGLYGYWDEAERFSFFCRGVLEALPSLGFSPEIIHCHDWHAGLISLFLKTHFADNPFYKNIRSVCTIHNLNYQGIYPKKVLNELLDLGDEYFTPEGLEFYGQVNFLKAGLVFSDCLTTVSRTYAQEIKDPFYGVNMEGILQRRSQELYGIINGIDYEVYDPMTDPEVFFPFRRSTQKKQKNKLKLQDILNLPQNVDIPVIAFVSRLVEQKGLDLIIEVLDEILEMDVQLVVLGTGECGYEKKLLEKSRLFPKKMSVNIMFADSLARKIYAGSDMFLMPSIFEPCGIGQLIALRYGSIPIVRETGGLKDTIQSFNEYTGEGNGFSFSNINAHDMLHTIRRAVYFYHQKKIWTKIVTNAVKADYSWKKSAAEYVELYNKLLNPSQDDQGVN